MIRDRHPLADDPEVRDVLKRMSATQTIERASFKGWPFWLSGDGSSNRWQASEATVYRMIEAKLLIVTNASPVFTRALGWNAPKRPWRCALSPDGQTLKNAIGG